MNKRLIITLAISIFLILAIFLTVNLLKQRQELRKGAVGGPASLSLSPASGTYNVGEAFDINIFLNDGGKKVAGSDVSLTFDSSKLSVETVTPGALFDDPSTTNNEQVILKNEVSGNKVLLSMGSLDPQTGTSYFAGSGVYGTVRLLAKEIGDVLVTIDKTPYSKIAEVGGGDILGDTFNGSYTITEVVTPTPTPSPTPTPAEDRCTDSDGGKNYYVRGSISKCIGTACTLPIPDICLEDGTTLKEYYCEGNEIKLENFACPDGCEDGACAEGARPTPTPAPVLGDLNDDGEINILDFSIFVDYYRENNLLADFNDDSGVDILDFSLFVSYYQQAQ